MSKFRIFRETAQYSQVPDLSTTAAGGDGEVKCGDSRTDVFFVQLSNLLIYSIYIIIR